ncbi:MAG: hypothetical protein IT303_06530 [Dehalococcoidia bacterium]|nr:hypothetical protein [Dehalococcoidia bacterium]
MAKRHLRQLREELMALELASAGLEAVDAARRLRETAEALEQDRVEAARKAGFSWSQVGALYGMSKQGAQQRFGPATGQPAPRKPRRKAAQPDSAADAPVTEADAELVPAPGPAQSGVMR